MIPSCPGSVSSFGYWSTGPRLKPEMRAAGEAMSELADSPLSGMSPRSQTSTVTLEDLELLLVEGLASSEPLSLEENLERNEFSPFESSSLPPVQDTSKRLEEWVAKLQAEVVSLRRHKVHCEQASLSLLRELLQVRERTQLQSSELRQLWQEMQRVAQVPEKEFPGAQNQNQMQIVDKRLVEVREALAQIRRRQALQDAERKTSVQEANLRLAKLTGWLRQEEQAREAACNTLQKSQEDTSQKVDHEVAKMQAQLTKLGEEMSLRFLKREAKLCSFLQKSFLALEQRMKALEGTRLEAERSLREELEGHWQKLQKLTEERVQALWGQHEQEKEGCLREQCRGLDAAVVRLTKFVRQNQMSLSHILLTEQKARVSKVGLEESQAGELASYVQENLEAVQLASKLARQETQGAMELGPPDSLPMPLKLQEKSQVLERSVSKLAQQLKDLGEHCLALSWRLHLQEQTLGLRLSEAKTEWEGVERKSLEDLVQWQKEVEAHLQEVREKVDCLPQQIEGVSDKCILHKSDADLKILAEGKAREFEVRAMRQELATVLSSVQLFKEDNPSRKIAEIQGKLATFQKQMIKLENSIQANKTIQNLKFNTETKLRSEEIAALRESMLHLWSEEGPWPLTLGSRRVFMSLVRQRFFIKDVAPGEQIPMNCWGIYQAVRWLQWKAIILNRMAQQRLEAVSESSYRAPVPQLASVCFPQK
ncbi:PREDICTED: coiled-coil domain-containing protein 154 isoform X2 [Chinchilla lanigera]|uniref:coiled-coil domain-containing protein 154 isoform X2 n=1 Tax=Chinchilla lanigera TaxID=34839 RepID=UPI00038EE022|nr:PREDICTED: coiled-coil domain-containing protein 154 isoform X2 [Chinchilla lanigera]